MFRDNLESDTLFFERVMQEEKEAGRIGDVAGDQRHSLFFLLFFFSPSLSVNLFVFS